MSNFLSNLNDNFRLILSMSFADVMDVLVVAVGVYAAIAFIRRTNSTRVTQGVLLLVVALWLASVLKLSLTSFILRQVFEIGVVAMIVLFQPEIRRVLERVGSYRIFSLFGEQMDEQLQEKVILQTVIACVGMAKSRTGALIVFERDNRLNESIATGTTVDAVVTADLLKNIFYDKSPLHDGAVIIRDGRLAAAACMLPLSESTTLSRELGMRHRAGIGMSERSDAVVVIVSEETGSISVAMDGFMNRYLDEDTLEKLLRRELMPSEVRLNKGLRGFVNRIKGKDHAEQDRSKRDQKNR